MENTETMDMCGSGSIEPEFGIDVKEFSRKLYNCLCMWLGNSMVVA